LGYLGCNAVEGREGENHVELGARIMAYFSGTNGLISRADILDTGARDTV
jgi:hypothetical protein